MCTLISALSERLKYLLLNITPIQFPWSCIINNFYIFIFTTAWFSFRFSFYWIIPWCQYWIVHLFSCFLFPNLLKGSLTLLFLFHCILNVERVASINNLILIAGICTLMRHMGWRRQRFLTKWVLIVCQELVTESRLQCFVFLSLIWVNHFSRFGW